MASAIETEGSSKKIDFEINIIPIIDCFTVLITFLLVSVSFLSLGVFEVQPAIPSQSTSRNNPPSVDIQLHINSDQSLEINFQGKVEKIIKITGQQAPQALANQKHSILWDLTEFFEKYRSIKETYPDVEFVTITAQDTVDYQKIMNLIDLLTERNIITNLGGF